MAYYTCTVVASWTIEVMADSVSEAEGLAMDGFLDAGVYDGVDDVVVVEQDED